MLEQLSSFRFVILLFVGFCLVAGCKKPPANDTDLFEQAEAYLQRGDYEAATRAYSRFLDQHPESPLADLARQRLLNIDRELEAVMGRRSAPAPIYVRPVDPGPQPEHTD